MNRIKLMRYERGLTRSAVAEDAGVPERTLRAIESGETAQPSAPHAKALADFYGVTVAELLGIDQREVA